MPDSAVSYDPSQLKEVTGILYLDLWYKHRLRSHLLSAKERVSCVLNGDSGHMDPQQKVILEIAEKHLTQLEEQIGQLLALIPADLNRKKKENGNGNGNGNHSPEDKQAIRELFRLVLHIVNNPLTIMSAQAQLLSRTYGSAQPELVEPLKTIVKNCDRIANELHWLQEQILA